MGTYEQYEDRERLGKIVNMEEFRSPYQDYRLYASSVTPGIRLGLNVIKPERPGYMLVQLHGWHMSMPRPEHRDVPGDSPYLVVHVDMRGRAFSEGHADCNGYELMDIYDAVQFAREQYADWLLAPEPVYLEGGSGGGGNVMATVGKFPDLFSAATALYGISDYAVWYEGDQIGEFRDEMDVWIGCSPEEDRERYAARSGIALAGNVLTPLYVAHGDGDLRVPVDHSRAYAAEMAGLGKGHLIQYDELSAVGARGHLTGASEEQLQLIDRRSEQNRERNRQPIALPEQGELVVGGYVCTKPFHLHLASVHQLAVVSYDTRSRQLRVTAAAAYPYRVSWSDGQVEEGVCEVKEFPAGR